MKKLMVVATAMILGSSVFGAAVEWNLKQGTSPLYKASSYVNSENPGTPIGGTMYVFLASYSQDTLLTALKGGADIATLAGTYGVKAADGTTTFSQTVAADGTIPVSTTFKAEVGDGSVQNFYEVVLGADGNYWIDKALEVSWNDKTFGDFTPALATSGRSQLDFTGDSTASWTKQGWYAVPEPTSGLLLLLGVAGLALRRRRA